MGWWLTAVKNYAVFTGRARRREYWYYTLFNFIFGSIWSFIVGFIGGAAGMSSGAVNGLVYVYILAFLLPTLAVSVRRLHDTGRTGWWILIGLIPLIGAIVLIIFYCEDSKPANEYGPSPKYELANAPA